MKRTEKRRKSEMGPDSAGQSGDTQQISGEASADSESVEELVEEGNPLEAGEVYGVENAKDPDVSETAATIRAAVAEAFVFGFRLIMLLCAGLAVASAAVAWGEIPSQDVKRTPSLGRVAADD